MAKILISYKILPTEVTVNLEELKQKIKKRLPEYSSVLVALIAHIVLPEDKPGGLDQLEKALQEISEISQIETLTVHRFS